MGTDNQDIIGENVYELMMVIFPLMKLAWKQNYEPLLNIEFPWSQNLPHVGPVAGPVQFITPDDILKSLRRLKNVKAAGPSSCCLRNVESYP